MRYVNSYNVSEYKSLEQIRNVHYHNTRDDRCSAKANIDPARTQYNRDLLNGKYGDRPLDEIIEEYLIKHQITVRQSRNGTGKHASVIATNLLFQPSHEYAYPDGQLNIDRVNRWVDAIMDTALPKILGGKGEVIAANLHMDERSPHLHVTVIPVDQNRLANKRMFSGRVNKRKHHTIIHEATQHLGFKRAKQNNLTATPHTDLDQAYAYFNSGLAELPFQIQHPHPGPPPEEPKGLGKFKSNADYKKQKQDHDQKMKLHFEENARLLEHAKAIQAENIQLKLKLDKYDQLEAENQRLARSFRAKEYAKLETELALERARTTSAIADADRQIQTIQEQAQRQVQQIEDQAAQQVRQVKDQSATQIHELQTQLDALKQERTTEKMKVETREEAAHNRIEVIAYLVNLYRSKHHSFMSLDIKERESIILQQVAEIEQDLEDANHSVSPPLRLGELVIAILTDQSQYKGKLGLRVQWESLMKPFIHNDWVDSKRLRSELESHKIPKAFTKSVLVKYLNSKPQNEIEGILNELYEPAQIMTTQVQSKPFEAGFKL